MSSLQDGTKGSEKLSNEISWSRDCRRVSTSAAPGGWRGGNGMAVQAVTTSSVRPTGTIFELEALEGLPCGCVAAAYRARPWDVAVVSLEAKGPHCILAGHTSGQVLRLGDPSEFDEDDEDEPDE